MKHCLDIARENYTANNRNQVTSGIYNIHSFHDRMS